MARVHRVQKVQRVQRVEVDGASPRGLWPPDGGRLCSLRSGGDSACGAEGGGGGSAADLKKGRGWRRRLCRKVTFASGGRRLRPLLRDISGIAKARQRK